MMQVLILYLQFMLWSGSVLIKGKIEVIKYKPHINLKLAETSLQWQGMNTATI